MSSESGTSAAGGESADLSDQTGSDLPESTEIVYRAESAPGEPDWRRRRRLDAIFGSGSGRSLAAECDEDHNPMTREWYDINRPPHHT